jgi:hypothetical protein
MGGLLEFDKMGRRESFLDNLHPPHDARFDPPPPKKEGVKIGIDFKKQTKRDSMIVKDPEILAYVKDPPPKERNFGYPSEPQEKKPEKKYQKVLIQGRL